MKTVKFENMGLYTLANLYLDCMNNDGSFRESDKKLATSIILYVCFERKDNASIWGDILEKCKIMRDIK